MSGQNLSNQKTSSEANLSFADVAIGAVTISAVVAIGYVLYRQKVDHDEKLKLVNERDRQREEYSSGKNRGNLSSSQQNRTSGSLEEEKNINVSSITTNPIKTHKSLIDADKKLSKLSTEQTTEHDDVQEDDVDSTVLGNDLPNQVDFDRDYESVVQDLFEDINTLGDIRVQVDGGDFDGLLLFPDFCRISKLIKKYTHPIMVPSL